MERLRTSRERIDHALSGAAPHLRPILMACRDYRCAFLVVAHCDEPFSISRSQPTVCIIGDDLDGALGPAGYHAESVRELIRGSLTGAVISCAPIRQIYQNAATTAVLLRRHSLIVETRLEREQEWIDFVRSANPKLPNVIATVAPMGSA